MTTPSSSTTVSMTWGSYNLSVMTVELEAYLRRWSINPDDCNSLECPVGLGFYSSGWFIMDAATFNQAFFDIDSLIPHNLTFAQPGADSVVFKTIYMKEAYPIDPNASLWCVQLVDGRFFLNYAISNRLLNAPVQGATQPTYIANTSTNTTTAYTLQEAVNKILGDMAATPGLPVSANFPVPSTLTLPTSVASDKPEALYLQNAPAARAVDSLLFTYSTAVLFDPTTNAFTTDIIGNGGSTLNGLIKTGSGTYSTEGVSSSSSSGGYQYKAGTPASVQTIATVTLPSMQPPQVSINYPIWGGGTGSKQVSQGGTGAYAYTGTSSSTSSSGYGQMIMQGTSMAYPPSTSGGSYTTPGTPSTLATAFSTRWKVGLRRDVYNQWFMPAKLVGALDKIVWRQQIGCLQTIIYYRGCPIPGERPAWYCLDSYHAASYHGCISRVDPFGRQQIFVKEGTFPVLLNKDGGSDGSATAVITDTYSVYRNLNAVIGTDTPDGTTLSPSYNRAVFNMTTAVASSNGVVITAAASGSIGQAYYDKNGNIALYSAPEAISWGC